MKQRIAFALIMAAITTAIISFVIIAVNKGFPKSFILIWFRSWLISYGLAFIAIMFISPRVQTLVTRLVKNDSLNETDK